MNSSACQGYKASRACQRHAVQRPRLGAPAALPFATELLVRDWAARRGITSTWSAASSADKWCESRRVKSAWKDRAGEACDRHSLPGHTPWNNVADTQPAWQ